jgi:hypothetical protein
MHTKFKLFAIHFRQNNSKIGGKKKEAEKSEEDGKESEYRVVKRDKTS